MIKHLRVVQYRGLQNLEFAGLRALNLISGPNGVGKTSLAEALWLFHGRYNPSLLWNTHVLRSPAFLAQNPLSVLGGPGIELQGKEEKE